MIRESDIEKYLVKRINAIGGEIRKVKWINRNGAPDRVVWIKGGVQVWVELKSPGKTSEPHQSREHKRMQRMGQVVAVIDSYELVDALVMELQP
jgi:hypothetical protein